MLARMKLFFDSFWRAAMYCLHPRVLALSILPLLIIGALAFALNYFFGASVSAALAQWLETRMYYAEALTWLEGWWGGARTLLPQLLLLVALMPVVVVAALMMVAWTVSPAVLSLVSERRFVKLERKKGGGVFGSTWVSISSLLLAFVLLAITAPIWILVLPLSVLIPPLIFGWLTYRVMGYDALSEHASKQERKELMAEHRPWLLMVGVICGYLGAIPGLVWASTALFMAFFVVLIPVAIWLYTMVFAFSSLWFAHYCLAALAAKRDADILPAEPKTAIPVAAPSRDERETTRAAPQLAPAQPMPNLDANAIETLPAAEAPPPAQTGGAKGLLKMWPKSLGNGEKTKQPDPTNSAAAATAVTDVQAKS